MLVLDHLLSKPSCSDFLPWSINFLNGLILDQCSELLEHRGVVVPITSVSTFLFIAELQMATISELARKTDNNHQLIAKRVEGLIKLGLVSRGVDDQDKRKRTLELTENGQLQRPILLAAVIDLCEVFEQMNDELSANLPAIVNGVGNGLLNRSILERVNSITSISSH